MRVQPKDEGLLGPDAVAWEVIAHPAALIGGLRSLIVQAMHPLAMAGVAQHSDYARRPLDRLRRTSYYVAATAFGDTELALAAAERVRLRHSLVRGVDPVTGRRYSADDPETQVWVHSTEWHSFLAAHRALAGGVTRADENRYFAEGAIVGSLLGTPRERVPASAQAMRDYFAHVRPQLCVSEHAREAIAFVISPRPSRELLPYYGVLRVYGSAALALVPRGLRRLAGIDRPRAVDAAALAAARPLLLASQLPVVHELAASVVGRDTMALIDSRRRPGAARQEAAAPLGRAA